MRRQIAYAVGAIYFAILLTGCSDAARSPAVADKKPNPNWSTYLGDNARQHYSPLDSINVDNVHELEVAWSYESEPGVDSGTMYTSPLVIDGVLYSLSPSLIPFALDAATGREIWRNNLGLRRNAQRGLMYWEKGGEQRIFFTAGEELIALNARTGELVAGFGDQGKVDITPEVETERSLSRVLATVPGVVYKDLIIMGFSTTEDADAYPGRVMAFSAEDGALVWTFNTLPVPGSPGSEGWTEAGLAATGGANVWTGMALDEERGIVFAPTGSATPDFYGGNRPGDNLFANSLIAIDANSGDYIWHHQIVRHDLWDKDNPSPPTLVQVPTEKGLIDAVTLTTKTGHLYAFDRETGESIYPLIEVPTPIPSTLPNEQPAASQVLSSKTISRQKFEVTQRTPEATQFVTEQIADWDLRPWAPPKLGTILFYPWYDGGAEWGGSAYNPNNRQLILNANDAAAILGLAEIPLGTSKYGTYLTHCGACHGEQRQGTDRGPTLNNLLARMSFNEVIDVINQGASGMPSFEHLSGVEKRAISGYIFPAEPPVPDPPTEEISYALASGYVYLKDHEGLPGNNPPWGTLGAIDLATGEYAWQVNFGNFPSHPDLNFGAINYGGPVVTAGNLVFIAATPDRKFRAYDAETGALLWQDELPAAGFSTPAVYRAGNRQFVVIAAGGGRLGPPSGSTYVAYALPSEG